MVAGEVTTLKDELIEISYTVDIDKVKVQKLLELRRVSYYSEKHNDTFIYWTNNLELKASEVINIYHNRWQIEKFFKKLKQNFPLQYFLGDNSNTIEIQIWCALIGLVLLQVIFAEQNTTIAFSILASIIAIHLMNYTSLSSIIEMYKQKRKRKEKGKPPNPKPKKTTPLHFQTIINF